MTWTCAYCNQDVTPDSRDAKPGVALTCPECGNTDYQPPAGGVYL